MADVGLGGTIALRASFRDGNGNLVDPVDPRIDIVDPAATVRVAGAVPVRESEGRYRYDYTVPTGGPEGTWRADWSGTVNTVVVSGSETFEVGPAGTVTAYNRWGLDAGDAALLTGVTVTDVDLENAEDEIVDVIGWAPDPDAYDPTTDVRARGFARAIAWQAAHRTAAARSASDGAGGLILSESIPGDYTVTYGGRGIAVDPLLAPRARQILRTHGWFRNVGATAGTGRARLGFDDWQRNRI